MSASLQGRMSGTERLWRLPFDVRNLAAFSVVAARTGAHDVVGIVRAAARKGNKVIDVIATIQRLRTPPAKPLLQLVLTLLILKGVRAGSSHFAGAPEFTAPPRLFGMLPISALLARSLAFWMALPVATFPRSEYLGVLRVILALTATLWFWVGGVATALIFTRLIAGVLSPLASARTALISQAVAAILSGILSGRLLRLIHQLSLKITIMSSGVSAISQGFYFFRTPLLWADSSACQRLKSASLIKIVRPDLRHFNPFGLPSKNRWHALRNVVGAMLCRCASSVTVMSGIDLLLLHIRLSSLMTINASREVVYV